MKRVLQVISFIALAASLAPACLFFADRCSLAQAQHWMLAATICWFVTVPFWMKHQASD